MCVIPIFIYLLSLFSVHSFGFNNNNEEWQNTSLKNRLSMTFIENRVSENNKRRKKRNNEILIKYVFTQKYIYFQGRIQDFSQGGGEIF